MITDNILDIICGERGKVLLDEIIESLESLKILQSGLHRNSN